MLIINLRVSKLIKIFELKKDKNEVKKWLYKLILEQSKVLVLSLLKVEYLPKRLSTPSQCLKLVSDGFFFISFFEIILKPELELLNESKLCVD